MTSKSDFLNKEQFHIISHDYIGGEIIDKLLRLHKIKPLQELQLLNFYKEVPISAPARSIRFADNTIFCRTNDTQSRAIDFSRGSIIKTPHLQHDIYASASYCPETREVALSDLLPAEVPSDNRSSIRVRMHVPMKVLIEAGTNKINGRMLDLSLGGCAVDIADGELLGNLKYMNINIDIPASTGREPHKLRVMVKLGKVFQHKKLCSCIFIFEHNKISEDQIGKLITQRQLEIIRELK